MVVRRSVRERRWVFLVVVVLGEGSSCWRRSLAILRSREVRYLAVEGQSGMICQANMATMMLGKPSTRKRARQGSRGPCCDSFTMSQAKVLAQLVASGAAEMKRPTR